jgi:YegS/Rv2252/BmrU family lipid kinase
VANPASGGGRGGRDFEKIVACLRAEGIAFDVARSERPGHVPELAAAAVRAGYRRFMAIGGDGTLSEVLNGVLDASAAAPGDATLALVPVGRGNDWARAFGIPRDYARAAQVVAADRSIPHDVGFADNAAGTRRYFLNCAGAGFDAHVVERTRGRDLGMLSYMAALPGSLLSFEAPELDVRAPADRIHGRVFMAFASINRYCGGGMLVAPHASCDDGLLDITILDEISLPELLLNIKKLYDGSLPSHKKVRTFRADSLEISGPLPVPCEADGEAIGKTPLRLGVLPRHVRVVVPA